MIDRIYQMGDDALANLFEMAIDPIPYLSDVLDMTLVRVQNVTIPASGANTYEVNYKGISITKPGGIVDKPSEFTFDLRVDRNWTIYRGLLQWKNAIADSYSGIIGPDGPTNNNRANVTIWAIQPNGEAIPEFGEWRFKGCFVQNVGDIGFDYSSGDPITVTVTMGTLGLDDTSI